MRLVLLELFFFLFKLVESFLDKSQEILDLFSLDVCGNTESVLRGRAEVIKRDVTYSFHP